MGDIVPVKPNPLVPQSLRDLEKWIDRLHVLEYKKLKERRFGYRALRRCTFNLDDVFGPADYLNGILSFVFLSSKLAGEAHRLLEEIVPMFLEGDPALPNLFIEGLQYSKEYIAELVDVLLYLRREYMRGDFDGVLKGLYETLFHLWDLISMEMGFEQPKPV